MYQHKTWKKMKIRKLLDLSLELSTYPSLSSFSWKQLVKGKSVMVIVLHDLLQYGNPCLLKATKKISICFRTFTWNNKSNPRRPTGAAGNRLFV